MLKGGGKYFTQCIIGMEVAISLDNFRRGLDKCMKDKVFIGYQQQSYIFVPSYGINIMNERVPLFSSYIVSVWRLPKAELGAKC